MEGVVQEKREKKSKGSYCAAYDCHNARGNCKLSMFRFPKDKERCLKWVQNSRRDDLRNIPVHKLYNYELCSNHFEESQFTNKEKKNRLIQTAVPTLFDVPNPPAKVTLSRPIKTRTSKCTPTKSEDPVSTPTSQKLDTPRRKKLKRKVQALRTKLWRKSHDKSLGHKAAIAKVIAQLKQYLPIDTVKFIERQIILHESHVHQQRYAIKDKMMALSIFYQSRKAYQLLSKLFALPSKRTLQRSLQKTNIMPGFSDTVFDALKLKVHTMDEKDRHVAVVFDEMSLKTGLVYNHGLDKIEGFEDLVKWEVLTLLLIMLWSLWFEVLCQNGNNP